MTTNNIQLKLSDPVDLQFELRACLCFVHPGHCDQIQATTLCVLCSAARARVERVPGLLCLPRTYVVCSCTPCADSGRPNLRELLLFGEAEASLSLLFSRFTSNNSGIHVPRRASSSPRVARSTGGGFRKRLNSTRIKNTMLSGIYECLLPHSTFHCLAAANLRPGSVL